MSKLTAQLAEHKHVIIRDDITIDSGHGVLPADCCKCKGVLDFVRVHDTKGSKTILRCRNCKHELDLD